jgi:hypothetical protein
VIPRVTRGTLDAVTYESKTWTVVLWLKAAEENGNVSRVPTATALFSGLYEDFTRWCAATRREPMTDKSFALALTVLKYPRVTGSRGVKMRGGLKIL